MAKPEYAVRVADVVETLAGVPLFQGVKPKELKKLANRMQERGFGEGDTITAEGKSGVGFFVIEDGNATVSVDGKIVRTLGPGEYFGEIALLLDVPRTASVIAARDCLVLRLKKDDFDGLLGEQLYFSKSLEQASSRRMKDTRYKINTE